MTARAGSAARLRVSGAGVSFTAEATTATGNISYQITNTAKRVWDRSATITVLDGGIATVESYTLNRLTGTVTFGSTASRTITVTGTYLPLSTLARGKEFDFSCMANNQEDNAFLDADVTRVQVEKDWSGTVGRWLSTDTYLADAFTAGVPVVVEFSSDGGTTVEWRGWGLPNKKTAGASKKTLVEDGIGFEGCADADGRSFTWLV